LTLNLKPVPPSLVVEGPKPLTLNPKPVPPSQVVEEAYRSKPGAKRLEPLPWNVLSNYTPIDLRSEDLTEDGALDLAVARILEQVMSP
jgi:hypothetical protein